jgi:hypothetical protein
VKKFSALLHSAAAVSACSAAEAAEVLLHCCTAAVENVQKPCSSWFQRIYWGPTRGTLLGIIVKKTFKKKLCSAADER